METKIDLNLLSWLEIVGQFILVVFAFLLNMYLDDLRDLDRKNSSSKNEVFDWVLNPDALYPLLFGVVFLFSVVWATEKTHDRKQKVLEFELAHTSDIAYVGTLSDQTTK
jgi:hypothetical protein